MLTRNIFLVILLLFFHTSTYAAFSSSENLELAESAGLRHYSSQDYEAAAENFTRAAHGGMKQSQYMLGFMYLKGQHVPMSLIEGMAWLGLAGESGEKEWKSVYKQIYTKATKEQRQAIKLRLEEFTSLYGMQAQNVSCKRGKKLGTNKVEIRCAKINEITEDMFLPRN